MAELGDTDDPQQLIPGDPAGIEANARVLQGRADSADDAGQGLLGVDTGSWTGHAADEFHDKFSYEPRKWFIGSDALQDGADALTGYASTLRWAQSQAREAIDEWNQGQQLTQQATADHNAATAQASAQHQPPPPPLQDPGEAHRQAARDMLSRAREQLHTAGDTAAQVLRGAAELAPEGSSWIGEGGRFLADAGGHLINDLASLGNAMVAHPGDTLLGLAGAGLTLVSGVGDLAGGALDLTGVGAVAGVPINAVTTAGVVAGATMVGGATMDIVNHAAGDDHVEPARTDYSRSEEPVPTAEPVPAKPGLSEHFENGATPKASDLEKYAQEQGWTKQQSPTGPPRYVDNNGIRRLTIERGSARTPGSENPHVEIRNEQGQRIDPHGNPVTRRSIGNHTPIEWDL